MKGLVILVMLISILPLRSLYAHPDDKSMAVATCLAGFAESPRPWSTSFFQEICQKIQRLPEATCIAGFARSSRDWQARDFLPVCQEMKTLSEAVCVSGFASSARSWNGRWFLDECRKLR